MYFQICLVGVLNRPVLLTFLPLVGNARSQRLLCSVYLVFTCALHTNYVEDYHDGLMLAPRVSVFLI